MSQIITRFAPSPTGSFHIGSARTALFNFLFTKKNKGQIFLRLEDTDQERSKKEYENNILESLNWLGLNFDPIDSGQNKFWRQSEREEVYKKYLEKMIKEGSAYISKEPIEQDQAGQGRRAEVIRFKNPNTKIKFDDLIRGPIEFDTTELGDFVIAKSLSEPLYHLAVVIDDLEMGVTHVIRGEDHISNTPRQILIEEALSATRPVYAHIPLILAPDRSKLSKRHGAVSLAEYKNLGYLPEAILNYLALLGWNPGTDQEIFSLTELIEQFDLKRVQKGGAIFNLEKLDWINKEHLKRLPIEIIKNNIENRIINYQLSISNEILEKLMPIIIERISKWGDLDQMIKAGELGYFGTPPKYDQEGLIWKKLKEDPNRFSLTQNYLKEFIKKIEELDQKDFSISKIKEVVWDYVEKVGRGEVLWPVRYALSGQEKSPDPFKLAEILGKTETISRLKQAVFILNLN